MLVTRPSVCYFFSLNKPLRLINGEAIPNPFKLIFIIPLRKFVID